jgi:hypothetical protein
MSKTQTWLTIQIPVQFDYKDYTYGKKTLLQKEEAHLLYS